MLTLLEPAMSNAAEVNTPPPRVVVVVNSTCVRPFAGNTGCGCTCAEAGAANKKARTMATRRTKDSYGAVISPIWQVEADELIKATAVLVEVKHRVIGVRAGMKLSVTTATGVPTPCRKAASAEQTIQ